MEFMEGEGGGVRVSCCRRLTSPNNAGIKLSKLIKVAAVNRCSVSMHGPPYELYLLMGH